MAQDDAGGTVGVDDEGSETEAGDIILLRNGAKMYSDWFPRQGDYFRATIDFIDKKSTTVKVRLFTKNLDTPGDGTNIGTVLTATQVGRTIHQWSPDTGGGIKQLVRYKIVCNHVTTPPVSIRPYALFRMLKPVWFDAVKAPTDV